MFSWEQADWCFGDETVERLQLNPSADSGGAANIEGDPALTNHNLLLGNIHKVEGEWFKNDELV